MKIIPLADRVVIKAVEVEETTKGGLILPGRAKAKHPEAELVAVGHGGIVDGNDGKLTARSAPSSVCAISWPSWSKFPL